MKHAAIAAAVTLLAAGSVLADWDDDCKYTAPRNLTTPAAGVTKVVIHAESGSLRVDGIAGATQVGVTGTACTSDDEFLDRIRLTARRQGSELHIESDIPDRTVFFGFFQARLDFAVTLPAGLPVTIDDGSGWIKVSNTGALLIDDDSGSIELRNIRGNVEIDDDSGEIDIDGVNGDVRISDDSGSITVKNVTGHVEIEDDSGSISVARVASLRIRNDDSGSISVQNVRGDVLIDEDGSGSIDVADIGGNFTVEHKGSGGIDYTGVKGKVRIPERHRR
ncbi:MAG TPA: DUF4097 family beta strand repeat-containing protein [Thermoanaerobaculia bacterium]|nr:DUF4097 family beta strand repeat-containing protein [Thermoanaerobaculia bacterium]